MIETLDTNPEEVMSASEAPQLTVLSFGGGQDSTAILYKLVFDAAFRAKYAPGRLLVLMADTKDEHPETMKHVENTKAFCRDHDVEFVHITPSMGFHGGKWQGYREFLRATSTCGSKAFRKTCTDNLKLKPIYRYLENWLRRHFGMPENRKKGFIEFASLFGKIHMLIGIAKGEEKRASYSYLEPWANKSLKKVYPLLEIGLDRQGCQDYIASLGLPVCPPSNCMLCPFMSEIELLWLHRNYPGDYAEWVKLEQNKIDRFRAEGLADDKNLGVWGKKLLPEKLAEAEARYGHMTTQEIRDYKQSHGHCTASRY